MDAQNGLCLLWSSEEDESVNNRQNEFRLTFWRCASSSPRRCIIGLLVGSVYSVHKEPRGRETGVHLGSTWSLHRPGLGGERHRMKNTTGMYFPFVSGLSGEELLSW
jgi:hypothetical protein